MTLNSVLESPRGTDLRVAYRKLRRILDQIETDLDTGLTLIDDQKTFESGLQILLDILREYEDSHIHEMRASEPPLTDIRFETRIYGVWLRFESLGKMIEHLILDIQTLQQILDPRFDSAATLCGIKAETVIEQVRKILVLEREAEPSETTMDFLSDWS